MPGRVHLRRAAALRRAPAARAPVPSPLFSYAQLADHHPWFHAPFRADGVAPRHALAELVDSRGLIFGSVYQDGVPLRQSGAEAPPA